MSAYRTQSLDTEPNAEAVVLEVFRRLTPAQKARLFDGLHRSVRALAIAGLRTRHPSATNRELELRYVARSLPADVMRRVHGWDATRVGR